jgi:hypothetical protein
VHLLLLLLAVVAVLPPLAAFQPAPDNRWVPAVLFDARAEWRVRDSHPNWAAGQAWVRTPLKLWRGPKERNSDHEGRGVPARLLHTGFMLRGEQPVSPALRVRRGTMLVTFSWGLDYGVHGENFQEALFTRRTDFVSVLGTTGVGISRTYTDNPREAQNAWRIEQRLKFGVMILELEVFGAMEPRGGEGIGWEGGAYLGMGRPMSPLRLDFGLIYMDIQDSSGPYFVIALELAF